MGKFFNAVLNTFFREATTSNSVPVRVSPRTGGSIGSAFFTGDAEAVATTYRCIDVICNRVANLHLQYQKRKADGQYVEDEKSSFHYLLSAEPMPRVNIVNFWYFLVKQMLCDGNAYVFPRVIMGEVTDLVLCTPNCVSFDDVNDTYTINDPYNGVYGTFEEKEIIHLYLHTCDGRRGESVLHHARRTMSIASAGDSETESRFINGGSVRGIVSNDKSTVGFGEYQDAELEKTATNVDDHFRNGERIVSLPGQVDFKQISLSSTDMQFLESRKFTVREICRFFGVHPSFVFDDTSNNYKSAENADAAFLSTTLGPILSRIEAEFDRKLIPRSLCCKCRFKFDTSGIYSLDLAGKASYYKQMLEIGALTINDIRAKENLQPIEDGDAALCSANLMTVAAIKAKETATEVAPKEAEPTEGDE